MNESKGLFQKYIIQKSDGSEIDTNADYFILRLDKDEHARKAILTYIESIQLENPVLANDLQERMCKYDNSAMNECISDNELIKGLLTKGKKYKCIAKNTIGDLLIQKDDRGEEEWYQEDFFKLHFYDLDTLPVVKARI